LFIHGFPLDRTVWRALVAPLTGHRRIVPDLRGFGLSDAPMDGCSVEGYADDMVALLDLLAVDRAVVCGLSMGGYIALDLVRRFPERVGELILMNTRADADGPEAKARRDDLVRLVEQNGTASLMDVMLPKLLAPDAAATMPGAVNHVRAMIGAVSPSGAVCALRAMKERLDSTPCLPLIAVPTLVVAGRDDQLIPVEQSRAMAKRIPGAQFTVIPGSGHLTPVEQPVATTRVVNEFLESLS
jgi:pimeloyl-ACP methyl ester carboxylesterase